MTLVSRRLYVTIALILCCILFCIRTASCAETRAVWADTWNAGFLSAAETTLLVDTAYNANYNVIIPEVRKCGDAYYNSAYEPRASNLIDPLPWDPLADIISKAHAKGIEVWPWIVAYRIWNKDWSAPPADHIWARHPEWVMKAADGSTLDGNNYNLDPGIPAVQDYIAKIVVDIITKYDVDGINYDYIRYPGQSWGYNEITKQRYKAEFGFNPPTTTLDPMWGNWAQYRRQQVTDLVRKCYCEIMARKPHVKHTVDTVGWMALEDNKLVDPRTDFTKMRQYREVFQDSKGWMEQHIIDVNVLMNYKREFATEMISPYFDQYTDFRNWTRWLAGMSTTTGRHGLNGPAAYLNSISDTVSQLLFSRSAGCTGMATYSYITTNKDGDPGSDFYQAVKYGVFPGKETVNSMPWKTNPTNAIVFGTVTDYAGEVDPIYKSWIYKATVTATGPVTRTSTTDATGTHSFIDLPPGTYTLTCAKAGYTPQTATLTVVAGSVIRQNFVLRKTSYVTIADLKAKADDWSASLPYAIVTAGSDQLTSAFYVEENNRSNGIKVSTSQTIREGSRATISGIMATNTLGERYIYNTTVAVISTGESVPRPLRMKTKDVGGTALNARSPGVTNGIGLNNIGLLVSVAGKVTYKDDTISMMSPYFYIDDGFALDDGSGHIGLKVKCYDLAVDNYIIPPAVDRYVRVTGIVSVGTGNIPVLRPRKQSDIEVLAP